MLKKKQKAAQNGRTFRKEETKCSAISKIYEEAGEKQGAKKQRCGNETGGYGNSRRREKASAHELEIGCS